MGKVILALLSVFMALPASAAPYIVTGTLGAEISGIAPITLPGAGLVEVSPSGAFSLRPGLFGPADLTLPSGLFTGVGQISGLTLIGVGNGTQVCDSAGCTGGLTGEGMVNVLQVFNLTIPLSPVGRPAGSAIANAAGITVTVLGDRWDVVSDLRTAAHEGSLVLRSGFVVLTNVAGVFPGFAMQRLSFAVEEPPKAPMILGAVFAVAGMAWWRRGR